MSGPTKKDLLTRIEKLDALHKQQDQEFLEMRGENSVLERKCDELSRELERVRSQNRSLSEAKYETDRRYAALLENSQRALALTTSILSQELPSSAPSQDFAQRIMRGEL